MNELKTIRSGYEALNRGQLPQVKRMVTDGVEWERRAASLAGSRKRPEGRLRGRAAGHSGGFDQAPRAGSGPVLGGSLGAVYEAVRPLTVSPRSARYRSRSSRPR
jgi:hypothetical protein